MKPKEQKQRELTEKLQIAEQEVAVKKSEFLVIQNEIAKMEADYDGLMRYINKLDSDKIKFEKRLVNAQKLLVLLSDEGKRWAETVEVLQKEIDKLVGDVFIAASSISYFGPFTGSYREKLVDQWI